MNNSKNILNIALIIPCLIFLLIFHELGHVIISYVRGGTVLNSEINETGVWLSFTNQDMYVRIAGSMFGILMSLLLIFLGFKHRKIYFKVSGIIWIYVESVYIVLSSSSPYLFYGGGIGDWSYLDFHYSAVVIIVFLVVIVLCMYILANFDEFNKKINKIIGK